MTNNKNIVVSVVNVALISTMVIFTSTHAMCASVDSKVSNIRAGVAQEKITPKMGALIGGSSRRRPASAVKSDLYTKALVVESGGKRIAIIINDLVAMPAEIVKATKTLIAQKSNIPADAVMICATHTHTATEVRKRNPNNPAGESWSDPEYNAELVQKMAAIVERACASMFNATVYIGQIDAKGYSKNRFVRMKDGRDMACYKTTPQVSGYDDKDIIGWVGSLDNSVQTLCVKDSNNKIRGMIVNFAAHPNAGTKSTRIWAQWPGDTAKRVAEEYGEDVVCLVLQGAAGDVDVAVPQEMVGKNVGEAAIKANNIAKLMKGTMVDCQIKKLKIPYCAKSDLAKVIAYYRRKKNITESEKRTMRSLRKFYKMWDREGKIADVPVQCIRIGDIALVGLPVEPFTALGLAIKKDSPAKQTFIVGYANDKIGYVPPADRANRCGYGEIPCHARWLVDSAAEMMVDSARTSLRQMWK